ncbi:MAG: hypothetical protein ACFB9M_10495 [Myxococcota bacterium]
MSNIVLRSVCLSALSVLLLLPTAAAQSNDPADFTVSEYVFRRLDQAQEALDQKKYREAHRFLDELIARSGLSVYEKSKHWQTRSYVYVSQDNLEKASEAMAKTLELNALPQQELIAMRFNYGQVLLARERFRDAAQVFRTWSGQVERPTPGALHTAAVAFVRAEDNRTALQFLDRALAGRSDPPTSWLQLKLAAHVGLKQWNAAINVAEDLLKKDPKSIALWKQMSALYGEAGRLGESVATLELAYRLGYLTKTSDIKILIQNLMASGVPLKAAEVADQALAKKMVPRNGEFLELRATAYVNASARKQAIDALEDAARATNKADIYAELGRIYLAEKNWGKASSALSKAVDLGGLKEVGQTYIMLGMAQHRQNNTGEAKRAFQKALQYRSSKDAAQSWLRFLSS